jgi:tellurite resistance protein TerC
MLWMYAGVTLMVVALLLLDLGVFHRVAHVVSIRESLSWSIIWAVLGTSFSVLIYFGYERHWLGLGLAPDLMTTTPMTVEGIGTVYNDGSSALIKYLTGYLVEKSLAVDNIFVIAMVFGFFAVPPIYQHRVLFWGIVGALLMRGGLIAAGAELIARFSWTIYIFGAFLIVTGVKMFLIKADHQDPHDNLVVRLVRQWIPITEKYHGEHFFVRGGSAESLEPATPGAALEEDRIVRNAEPGALLATPLFLALVSVEFTDLIFAVDSIPAIFAVTTDPFLVFTSNIFAILGLRSLYFALAGMIDKFKYLKASLAAVLLVVGVKMMMHSWLKDVLGPNFNLYLLGVVTGILAAGIIASLTTDRKPRPDRQTARIH